MNIAGLSACSSCLTCLFSKRICRTCWFFSGVYSDLPAISRWISGSRKERNPFKLKNPDRSRGVDILYLFSITIYRLGHYSPRYGDAVNLRYLSYLFPFDQANLNKIWNNSKARCPLFACPDWMKWRRRKEDVRFTIFPRLQDSFLLILFQLKYNRNHNLCS